MAEHASILFSLSNTQTTMAHHMMKQLIPIALLVLIFADCRNATATPQAKPTNQAPQQAVLSLSGMFTDHMVLQRECDAAIWGNAKPKTTVTVTPSWSKQTFETQADAEGRWRCTVKTPQAGGPHTVAVSSGGDSVTLKDVLIGEVWICSGQSNMQWKLRGFGIAHFKEDVDKATFPQIRFCDVPQVIALKGQDMVKARWTPCSPKTALAFSAVGYFFGSRLHQELNVPIGLVSTNWGGSSAEAWVSPEVLKKQFPEFNTVSDRYAKMIEQTGDRYAGKKRPKGLNQKNPSVLYNSMIHPLIPFSFRGVVWYQGESNVAHPEQYRTLFPAMIRDWRARWGNGDFPFYYVQIAPFAYKNEPISAAFLREAQMMTLSEPNTGMVVTMDIGNPANIHPKQKKPVGERLARLALKRDYGRTDLVDSGPAYKSHKVEDNSIRLQFTSIGDGLSTGDDKPLTHFTIAGADKKFVAAKATIDGDTIVVRSENVTNPIAVRYAWGSGDMPNLSNKEGLPVSSFRTDDWPIQPASSK